MIHGNDYSISTKVDGEDVHVNISFAGVFPDGGIVEYIAAAPVERRASYTGSGLPYASASMAFENTPNKGTASIVNGYVKVTLRCPNSYYVGLGTVLVPPTLYLTYYVAGVHKQSNVLIGKGIPYRSLTYPASRSQASFYDNIQRLPVRSQEQVLRDSAFPEHAAVDFWGLKPAL